MVVDCGGGTVDVISYKATGMDPMVVREVVKGKGRCEAAGTTFPLPFSILSS